MSQRPIKRKNTNVSGFDSELHDMTRIQYKNLNIQKHSLSPKGIQHRAINIQQYKYEAIQIQTVDIRVNQRSQRDDSRIQKERNKANDFTFKLQYDASIFSNRRQSDFTKCSLMISQREIMISQLV